MGRGTPKEELTPHSAGRGSFGPTRLGLPSLLPPKSAMNPRSSSSKSCQSAAEKSPFRHEAVRLWRADLAKLCQVSGVIVGACTGSAGGNRQKSPPSGRRRRTRRRRTRSWDVKSARPEFGALVAREEALSRLQTRRGGARTDGGVISACRRTLALSHENRATRPTFKTKSP